MRQGLRLAQVHSRVALFAHVVWATARREPTLVMEADGWFARVLAKKAGEHGCELLACGCASDHVHGLVRYRSTVTVASLVQKLKGYTSYAWNAASGRRLRWQAGYWAESVSPADLSKVEAYVLEQRQRHARGHVAEAWEVGADDDFDACDDTVGGVRP